MSDPALVAEPKAGKKKRPSRRGLIALISGYRRIARNKRASPSIQFRALERLLLLEGHLDGPENATAKTTPTNSGPRPADLYTLLDERVSEPEEKS